MKPAAFILIFLLVHSDPCFSHISHWDKSISDYLHLMMSFEEFSRITRQAIDCTTEQRRSLKGSIDEGEAQRRLFQIAASTDLPMLKEETVLRFGGDFQSEEFCGPYLMELAKNEFVHLSMQKGRLYGPAVVYHNGQVTIKSLGGKEEDHGEWTLKMYTATYKNLTGKYFVTLLQGEKACPSLVLDDNLSTRVATVEVLQMKDSFLVPTFQATSNHLDLAVSAHLLEDHKDDPAAKEIILSAMYSLHCQVLDYKTPPSLVANQRLFDLTTKFPKTTKATTSTWNDDEECSEYATVLWHDNGALHKTFLACFPGSGSKWIMETIQFASGLGTNEMSQYPSQFLQKTHHDDPSQILQVLFGELELRRRPSLEFRFQEVLLSAGRGILVVRNPYEAILSWWNHAQTRTGYSAGLEPEALLASLQGENFCRFARAEIVMWRTVNLDWITLIKKDLIVVHYENFREDWQRELERLLSFLRVHPVDRARLRCLARNPIVSFKRETVELLLDRGKVFCQEATQMIEEAIAEVDEALRERSFDQQLPTHLYKYREDSQPLGKKKKQEL